MFLVVFLFLLVTELMYQVEMGSTAFPFFAFLVFTSMSSTSWCPHKTISHTIVSALRYTRDYWSVSSNPTPSLGVLIGFFCSIEEMR